MRIDDIAVDSLGYTGFAPGDNPFPDWIRQREWGVVTRTVRIAGGFRVPAPKHCIKRFGPYAKWW